LLSDVDGKMVNAYGADGFIFAKRTSFLVSPKGIIENIYEKVKPQTHAEDIINDTQNIKS